MYFAAASFYGLRKGEAMEGYRTVQREGTDSFTERKSRFIGCCRPVRTEEEALEFIKEKKTEHWDASHTVYAYVLREGNTMRYSDDGEPQGTAGVPVLEVLRKSGITDAVIAVTRYFGGILLGAGGLVRAYSHGASIAVAAACPVEMRKCAVMSLRCGYSRYPKAEAAIRALGGEVDDIVFEDAVTLKFHLLPESIPELTQKVADLTGGKGVFHQEEEAFFGIESLSE